MTFDIKDFIITPPVPKTLIIPSQLKDLPVSKILPTIDLTSDMCFIGATGSGKTMLIPPTIAKLRNRLVIVRQPTRSIAKLTHRALTDFFGDQLSIGIITSDDKEVDYRYINSYNIILITDGVLTSIIKKLDMSRSVIIFDESHWGTAPFEIELSIAEAYKKAFPSLQIVLLSATIQPYIFVNYFEKDTLIPTKDSTLRDICYLSNNEIVNTLPQPQHLKVFYSEGVAYPTTKQIIKVPDINDIDDEISKFCYHIKNINKFGIVFLSTRNEIASAAKDFFYVCPTFFCHADTPIEELLEFFKTNSHGVVFATIALSTSVTLPFTEVMIVDKSNGSQYIESIEQKIDQFGIPCDYNEILQKAGRVGRMFPGKAILVTSRDITWDKIIPTSIIPPLSKELPITAALISASHGIDIRKAHLLTTLSESQMSNSIDCLTQYKFIDETGTITPRGTRALSLPLSIYDAKLLLSTPTAFLPATAAFLSFPAGMFYLIDTASPNTKTLYSKFTFNSIPITKICILQSAISNKDNLKNWCASHALNYKKIQQSLFNFHQIGRKLSKEPEQFENELLTLDFSPSSSITSSYRTLINMLLPKYYAMLNGSGISIPYGKRKYFSFFSDKEFFASSTDPFMPVKVSGRFSLFQSKGKSDIYGRISDATLPPATIPEGMI